MRLEPAVRRLMRAARKDIHAQERMDFWQQFGTGSTRVRKAEDNHAKAMADLERAEADIEEALFQASVGAQ